MNAFAIRYVREGMHYRGEYRLAHWSGPKPVMDEKGETMLFAQPLDALVAAQNEFLGQLNGCEAYWRGSTPESAREAAEKIFRSTRDLDGQGKDKIREDRSAARKAPSSRNRTSTQRAEIEAQSIHGGFHAAK